MNIRTKLIVMLAVPLVALAVVAFVGFSGQNAQLEINEDATVSVATITNLDRLWLAVADERLAVIGTATEQEAADFVAATDAIFEEIAESADSAGAAVAAEAVELLPANRSESSIEALDAYNNTLDAVSEGLTEQPIAGLSPDAALAVSAIADAHRASRQQEDAWLQLTELENLNTTTVRNLIASFGSGRTLREIAAANVITTGERPFLAPVQSPSAAQLGQIEALVLARLVQAEGDVLTDSFIDDSIASLPSISLFDALENNRAEWNAAGADVQQLLLDDIAETEREIDNGRSRSLFLALVGGLLLVTLIFVIGRSIIGPLSRLMANADVMTHERLPAAVAQLRTIGASDETPTLAPIPKENDDEIGTIVEAFNDMQVSALRVATDQARSRRNVAEMFVNLGRRNQQLNHRMITMISDLEQDEQDPETLRGLYQLDHLATRMRRNAESLLVLAGNRSPRQWKQPVAFDDVVRSSLAEVEYFERVEIGELPEVSMTGAVVADVTHMLAELLDNATNFSDPTSTVAVSALETHTAIELQIRDSGFGIDESDLRILNERLSNPPELDEAPSRLLGLFVVGRLAQQHGVQVELRSVSGEGTTATVTMPKVLFPVEATENPIATPDLNADTAADFFAQEAAVEAASEQTADVIPLPIPDVPPIDVPPVDVDPIQQPIEAVADEETADDEAEEAVAEVEEAEAEEAIAEVEQDDESDELEADAVAEVSELDAEPDFDDEPEMAEAEPAESPAVELTEDSWPLTKLSPAPARAATPMDVAQRSAEVTQPEPEPVEPTPPAVETVAEAPTVESAPVSAPNEETSAPAADAAPISSTATATVMPAPPIVESAPVVESAPEPGTPVVETTAAPSESSFGGLPTRMPQATIEEVETAPKVLPLLIEEDAPASTDAASSSISFGHFAKGAVADEAANSDEGENS